MSRLCYSIEWVWHALYNMLTLLWRRNRRGSVSNQQPHDCLLNRLFRRRSKKTSKLRVTGLCAGNSPGTQMISNAENVSIWCRHHEKDERTESGVMDERDILRFEFKVFFGRISYTVQSAESTQTLKAESWSDIHWDDMINSLILNKTNILTASKTGIALQFYSRNTWLCVHWQWNTREWCH